MNKRYVCLAVLLSVVISSALAACASPVPTSGLATQLVSQPTAVAAVSQSPSPRVEPRVRCGAPDRSWSRTDAAGSPTANVAITCETALWAALELVGPKVVRSADFQYGRSCPTAVTCPAYLPENGVVRDGYVVLHMADGTDVIAQVRVDDGGITAEEVSPP